MVRGKRNRKTGFPDQMQVDTLATGAHGWEPELSPRDAKIPGKRFTLLDYIGVCVFFIAFCYLQKLVAQKWLGVNSADLSLEGLSLTFFFDTMWKGFIIVALLAWLHDFFYHDTEEDSA